MNTIAKDAQKPIRLSLDLKPAIKDQLDDLQKRIGAPTLVEVIRKSLALYELFVEHEKSGGKVILENPDGSRERLKIL